MSKKVDCPRVCRKCSRTDNHVTLTWDANRSFICYDCKHILVKEIRENNKELLWLIDEMLAELREQLTVRQG